MMKSRLLWCSVTLLLVAFGGVVGGILANVGYRPDQTWGDLRPLAVLMGAAFGALFAGLVTVISFVVVRAWNAARKAEVEYSQLPPEVAKRTSREWFILRPAMLVLAPLIAVLLLGALNRVVMRWQIARHSSPYADHWRSSGRPVNPTANSAVKPVPTPTTSRASSNVTEPVNVSEAQKVWGELWYSNATLLQPNQTSPRPDVPFALLMLMSGDSFENIVNHYRARLSVAKEQNHKIVFRGTRGDGKSALVAVQRYPNEPVVYITLSSS